MLNQIRSLLIVFVGLLTIAPLCGGKKPLWFRVSCAVARGGGVEDQLVYFRVDKRDQDGNIVYNTTINQNAWTLETGWTTPFVCSYDMTLDSRTEEYNEDIRVIAMTKDEEVWYSDTAFFRPQPFLSDTQSVSLRIDLPYRP